MGSVLVRRLKALVNFRGCPSLEKEMNVPAVPFERGDRT
jgi:hypothetical protein